MLTIDTILQERYRIVRPLGQGGMGAVYEAIDEKFGTPVALKEIHLELANLENEKQRDSMIKAFRREAKSLAKARHEAVPFVRDYFSELNNQFLVMEMVEGEELSKMLKRQKKPFPLEDALDWLEQLLDALDYLHTLKPPIIHRDIKPQNLKLTPRGKIKLLDFGIAKSTDKSGSTITNQTFVGATLNFSPIEQLLHVIDPTFREFILLKHREKAEIILNQTTDGRCDLYSVGATFYHLLTQHQPMDSTKRTLDIWEGKNDPLLNPSELNSEIPQSISDCLVKAMEVERDNRFSTALEMLKALQTAVAEEKDKGKTVQMVSLPAEQIDLQIEEEKISQKKKTEAKTERLIEIDTNDKAGEEIFSDILPPPIEPPNLQLSPTFVSEEIVATDYEIAITDISANKTSDNLAGQTLYEDEQSIIEQKEPEPESVSVGIKPTEMTPLASLAEVSTNNRKSFLTLPMIGVLVFAVLGGGVYGIFSLMNSSEATSEPKSTIENSNSDIIAPSEVTTTIESNSNTADSDESKPSKTKPTVQPTKQPVVAKTPKPVATPKPTIKQTPKPKPTQTRKPKAAPTKDPRCVYTNSC